MEIPVLNFSDFVHHDGELFTTSDRLAVVYGERHALVSLQVQYLLAKLPPCHQHHFEAMSTGRNCRAEPGALPRYRVSQFGFTLLAVLLAEKDKMGPTVAMLNAFEAMPAMIQNQSEGLRFAQEESAPTQLPQGQGKPVLRRKLRRTVRDIH